MKTKTKTRSKTRTLVRSSGTARRVRDLLAKVELPDSKELWKRIGESPSLVRVPGDSAAELRFLSKDRTHAAVFDCNVKEEGLEPAQAMLHLHLLAHLRSQLECPLTTASVIFMVPEGSAAGRRLVATFNDSYRLPSLGLRKSSLSEARFDSRGSRLAKNAFRYSVALSFKGVKFNLRVAVKVVEAPPAVFETTQLVMNNAVFVPIPGSKK